jgi:hypothetical protein
VGKRKEKDAKGKKKGRENKDGVRERRKNVTR